MRRLFGPFQIVALLVTIAGFAIGRPPVAILGGTLWVLAVAVALIRESGKARVADEMGHKERAMLLPLIRLRDDIAKLVEENQGSPSVKVVGAEALREADALVKKARTLARADKERERALHLAEKAEIGAQRLRDRIASADEGERSSLEQGVLAREAEAQQQREAVARLDEHRNKLHEAETALFELKSRLTVAAVDGEADALEEQGLGGMVGRLRSLSASIDEAEEMQERI